MSDRFWATIRIGGPVPPDLVPELCNQLDLAGLFSPDRENLDDHIDNWGMLSFEDCEACYGWFEDLENWLGSNGIEFDRQSDGYCEIDPELVAFRRGIGLRAFTLDHNGYHTVRIDTMLEMVDGVTDLGSLVAKLRELAGQDLTRLQPFSMVAVPKAVPADELKRRNTDPAATSCAQCDGPLSDPGLGPAFRYCPKCEP